MFASMIGNCISTLAGVSPIAAMLLAFVTGYLAVGIPVQLRHGAVSRDIWGTAGGLCVAAAYAAVLAGIVPALHHLPSTTAYVAQQR
jgi:hypothetical protein